ncbi:MAG: ThuA domain-containing protein [Rhodoferax sp.]|nr:ThuA domain-containing protein [Rhodoferax sp.]
MLKNIILTGGLYHPFEQAAATLSEVLQEVGVSSVVTDDLDHGFELLQSGEFDLLTVYALRWTMPQEKFKDDRATWGYQLSDNSRTAITDHLKAGKGILALHTAAICFDDWPGWRDTVGAGWQWGHSFHPPLGTVHVQATGTPHPIVGNTTAFSMVDEAYTQMDLVPGLQPLLEIRDDTQSAYSPCLWAREIGGGRVVYDAIGHDSSSFLNADHKGIVQRACQWASGQLS